jgi:hypothetical protein
MFGFALSISSVCTKRQSTPTARETDSSVYDHPSGCIASRNINPQRCSSLLTPAPCYSTPIACLSKTGYDNTRLSCTSCFTPNVLSLHSMHCDCVLYLLTQTHCSHPYICPPSRYVCSLSLLCSHSCEAWEEGVVFLISQNASPAYATDYRAVAVASVTG